MSSEATARELLLDMQRKLATGPHAALGIPSHATAADIRSAFLELTKVFHPARFGRMATDIQRLSNEVFLSLRAAHDQLAKPAAPSPTRPPGRSASTTGVPVTKPATTGVPVTKPVPATTRPFGVPVAPTTPNPVAAPRPTRPPEAPHRQTQPLPTTATKPPTTPPAGPPTRPTPVPASASGTRPPAAQTRPSAPAGAIRFPPSAKPPTAPPATPAAKPSASGSQGVALDPELALILQLMGMGQWDAAQAAIDALATKSPQNKRYAALACYSRGRRAQLEGNLRIAQIELNDALQLDPDLDVAKSAFAELYARRK